MMEDEIQEERPESLGEDINISFKASEGSEEDYEKELYQTSSLLNAEDRRILIRKLLEKRRLSLRGVSLPSSSSSSTSSFPYFSELSFFINNYITTFLKRI